MLTELEKAHEGLSEHQRCGDVRRRMEKVMARADSALETDANYPVFVSAAVRFADRTMLLGRDLDPAVNFLERGLTLAEKQNDRRRRCLIQLTLGRLFMMFPDRDRALSALSEGAAGVMELGDNDIMEGTARPLSLFYFLQGRYREALDHAESALRHLYCPDIQWFQTAPITVAGLSVAFLGQYRRSVGMLDFHCHLARKNGRSSEPSAAYIPQAALGLLLDVMNDPRQARLHIDRSWSSLAADNRHGRIIALRTLAFHFHQKGDLEKAAETAGRIRRMAGQRTVGSIYTPWVLEMYHDLERKGFGGAIGWAFQEVFDALMKGPNAHLRGTALRLRAIDALAGGETAEAALNRLSESETLLKTAEAPVQLALPRIEMARLKFTQEKREEGAALAILARRGVAGVREAVFPDDLRALMGDHLPPEINARADENLDRVFTLFEDISPALTGAFPDAFLSAANRFFWPSIRRSSGSPQGRTPPTCWRGGTLPSPMQRGRGSGRSWRKFANPSGTTGRSRTGTFAFASPASKSARPWSASPLTPATAPQACSMPARNIRRNGSLSTRKRGAGFRGSYRLASGRTGVVSTGGKISGPGGAAEILGMKRATLYTRMGKMGLR